MAAFIKQLLDNPAVMTVIGLVIIAAIFALGHIQGWLTTRRKK